MCIFPLVGYKLQENKDYDYFLLITVSPEDAYIYILLNEFVNMLDTMIGKQRYKKTKKCHQFSRNLKYCRIEKK